MLAHIEFIFILLEFFGYLLKPLVELLQIRLNLFKQTLISTIGGNIKKLPLQWAGISGGSSGATTSSSSISDLNNEISAYCELYSKQLEHKLTVYEYNNSISSWRGDLKSTLEAAAAIINQSEKSRPGSVGVHATSSSSLLDDEPWWNVQLLKQLQTSVLTKWPTKANVQLTALDNSFVRLLDWSSCDLLIVSGSHEEEAADDSQEFDWNAFLTTLLCPLISSLNASEQTGSASRQYKSSCESAATAGAASSGATQSGDDDDDHDHDHAQARCNLRQRSWVRTLKTDSNSVVESARRDNDPNWANTRSCSPRRSENCLGGSEKMVENGFGADSVGGGGGGRVAPPTRGRDNCTSLMSADKSNYPGKLLSTIFSALRLQSKPAPVHVNGHLAARIIYSASHNVNRTALISLKINNNNNSSSIDKISFNNSDKPGMQTERAKQTKVLASCLLKHLTLNEYTRHNARCQLIFYLCQDLQLCDNLIPLYAIVANLLNRARLLEPSGFCLRAEAIFSHQTEKPTTIPRHHRRVVGNNKRRSLSLTDINDDNDDDSDGDDERDKQFWCPPSGDGKAPLSRYALVLMLAGYLNARRKRDAATRGRWRRRRRCDQQASTDLGSLLVGFLGTYSMLLDDCNLFAEPNATNSTPTSDDNGNGNGNGGDDDDDDDSSQPEGLLIRAVVPQRRAGQFELELVRLTSGSHHCERPAVHSIKKNSERDKGQGCLSRRRRHRLIVLDPVYENESALSTTKRNNAKDEATATSSSSTSAGSGQNLIGDSCVWPEIRQLFERLYLKLVESTAANCAPTSISPLTAASARGAGDSLDGPSLRGSLLDLLFNVSDEHRLEMQRRHHDNIALPQADQSSSLLHASADPGFGACAIDDDDELSSSSSSGGSTIMQTASCNEAKTTPPTIINSNSNHHLGKSAPSKLAKLFSSARGLWRIRVSRNVLYFTLFLLIRSQLVSYLQGLQQELKQQTRDDMIELKRMLYPEGSSFDSLSDAGDDGISILLRQQNEEDEDESEAKLFDDFGDNRAQDQQTSRQDSKLAETMADNERGDDQAQSETGQLLATLFGSILSESLKGGAHGGGQGILSAENLERIMASLDDDDDNEGDGENDDDDDDYGDLSEMSELLAQFQHLLPGLMSGSSGGGGGGIDLSSLFKQELLDSIGLTGDQARKSTSGAGSVNVDAKDSTHIGGNNMNSNEAAVAGAAERSDSMANIGPPSSDQSRSSVDDSQEYDEISSSANRQPQLDLDEHQNDFQRQEAPSPPPPPQPQPQSSRIEL